MSNLRKKSYVECYEEQFRILQHGVTFVLQLIAKQSSHVEYIVTAVVHRPYHNGINV